jgi:hypothetical protein
MSSLRGPDPSIEGGCDELWSAVLQFDEDRGPAAAEHAPPGVRPGGCWSVLAGASHLRLPRAGWRQVERQAKTEARPSRAASYTYRSPQ